MQAYQLYNCHVNQIHYQFIETEKSKKLFTYHISDAYIQTLGWHKFCYACR